MSYFSPKIYQLLLGSGESCRVFSQANQIQFYGSVYISYLCFAFRPFLPEILFAQEKWRRSD